jgi:hypothetical protein
MGRSVGGHLAVYATTPAQLGLAAQIAFALFPWLQTRPRAGGGPA